jgi:hypothetical protein
MTDLALRDYVLIVDKSGSMQTPDCNGKSRWKAAEESTFALAVKCEQFDTDGIDLYLFNGNFRKYSNTTSAKVADIFKEHDPQCSIYISHVVLHEHHPVFSKLHIDTVKQLLTESRIISLTEG